MRSISRLLWIAALAATVFATPARAADKLDSIMKKSDLSNADKALVDQEVQDRASRLASVADESPDEREKVRGRLLETLSISGATDAALNYYADRCAYHLAGLVLSTSRPAGEDAAMILRSVNRPAVAPALVSGLRSPFESVQYHCAAGIKSLRSAIGDDRSLVSSALTALGDIGATTRSEALLQVVYEATDFCGAIQNFAVADLQAKALTKILRARMADLRVGSQDELKDAAGYQAALSAAKTKLTIESKRDLLAVLVDMLEAHARRYGDRETSKDYLPTLRRLVGELERAIQELLRSESTNPPGRTLSGVVKDRPNSSQAKDALRAIDDLRQVIKQEPWNIG
ncbi:MAG: hypothetical protein H6818_04535 [Phycisphaerales bacterium]|nr:hypothetical protein [Phycisphaerales bacterium]